MTYVKKLLKRNEELTMALLAVCYARKKIRENINNILRYADVSNKVVAALHDCLELCKYDDSNVVEKVTKMLAPVDEKFGAYIRAATGLDKDYFDDETETDSTEAL